MEKIFFRRQFTSLSTFTHSLGKMLTAVQPLANYVYCLNGQQQQKYFNVFICKATDQRHVEKTNFSIWPHCV